MNTNHKPGPWKLQELPPRVGYPGWIPYAVRDEKTNVHIATVGDVDRYFEGEEQTANARLIAAAPELLADLLDFCEQVEIPLGVALNPDGSWDNLRAADKRLMLDAARRLLAKYGKVV